jgi:hypothetical protein
LTEVVRRHEVLRTTFATRLGRPVQVVAPPRPQPLPVIDLTGLPAGERQRTARRLGQAEADRPFDLERGPLLRTRLLRLAQGPPAEHAVLVTVHHTVSDGGSLPILVREVATLYAAFAAWQRAWLAGDRLAEQIAYWRRQLADLPLELDLPTDRLRPTAHTFRGALIDRPLPRELVEPLRMLARAEGATLFMTLLTAFKLLLARWSGRRDVFVGTPQAGRSRPETEDLIGFFVNNLVLRTDLSGDPTFRQALARVRKVALDAYAHQDVPFEMVLEALRPDRDLGRMPLFQVFFSFQPRRRRAIEIPGIEVLGSLEREQRSARVDLTWLVIEREHTLVQAVEYSTDLFDRGTIDRLVERMEVLLAQIVADPDCPLSSLRLLGSAETGGYEPTDFPDAGLSQQDLEGLFEEIQEASE